MAESPQRRGNVGISPYVPVACGKGDADPTVSYATTSRSGRRTSGVGLIQGLSNRDERDGLSQPSKRSRLFYEDEDGDEKSTYNDDETGSLYSVGIQTSPREDLFDDMSEHAVEAALDCAPERSFGNAASRSRNSTCDRLPAAFPLPGVSSQSRPLHSQQPMMPGDRSQGYLTPPQSSEPWADERPLSRQGGLALAGSPVQRKGNGRDGGGQPHPQWQFEEDTVSVSPAMYN